MELHLSLSVLLVLLISCNNNYTLNDFTKVKKTDAHFHIYTAKSTALEQAKTDNFRLMSVNVYNGNCERVVDSNNWTKDLKKKFPAEFNYACTFCLDGWDDSAWVDNTIAWIDQCIADGAIAVKVWKNIGMEFRDKDGKLIMIDDPQFDPIFKHLAEIGIPLVGHLGEPKNCWLPLNEMTTHNDRNYFAEHTKYHMYKHPEYPSYEEQMAARDRMLDKNSDLVFIGCHLASLEWSVDKMSEFLDRYPNSAMDMAARMGQLFYQTKNEREKVRSFFIKYQDRILYGTDILDTGGDKEKFFKYMHSTWTTDWEYLVTDNKMTSDLIDGEFRGLKLPKDVVDKIYFLNAKKWYKMRWQD